MIKGSVGKLLKNKNALLNYIYIEDARVGVVVGLHGKDRDNPLIGWTLFKEVDPSFFFYEKELSVREKYHTEFAHLENALRNNKETFEDLKILGKAKINVLSSEIDKDCIYSAIEKAVLRANPNRDDYYVCDNPEYMQNHFYLRPSEHKKTNDSVAITYSAIRKAVRAMEYRCWKYFKA